MRIAGNMKNRGARQKRYRLIAALIAGCFAFAGNRAQAQEAVTNTYGSSNGTLAGGTITKASPSEFQRLLQPRSPLGNVGIVDAAKGRVGSVDVAMVLERRLPWSSLARGAAVIGRTIPYVATAVAFIDLMDSLRLRSTGTEWKQDPGVPQTSENQTVYSGGTYCNGQFFGSPNGVGNCMLAAELAPKPAGSPYGGPLWSATGTVTCTAAASSGSCTAVITRTCTNTSGGYQPSQCGWGYTETQNASTGWARSTQTLTQCPASIDALNPANSIAAGGPVGYDGKCRTGRYTDPKSETQAGDILIANGDKTKAVAAATSLLDRGVDLAPRTDTPVASGPSSVPQPATTTTSSGPSGTTTGSSTPTSITIYNGPNYTWNDSTVVTTTNGGGTTTTTTNAPPPATVETCGLPGKPPCKIDESGTPPMPPVVDPTVGQVADDAARRTAADAQITDPAFGWFSAPPVVTCTPFEWPGGFSLNPCGPMEIVRSIMAYLWAIFAAWWSFGIVRRTIVGS